MSRDWVFGKGGGASGAALIVGVAIALLVLPASGAAQSPLERVQELTRMGRTDEARTLLMQWWETDQDQASRRDLQRALWLRGRLTVDPSLAELDFQRLAVLYPSGEFTPDAIFRLAQASWAMGDEAAARRYVATLERDYPRSDAGRGAAAWLASAGPLPPRGDTPTGSAQPPATGDRPTVTRIPPSSGGASTGDAGDASMNYYVQLGAFSDEERAFSVYEDARAAGIDVRVVRVEGSNFTHVRVGRFAERQDAVDLLEQLTARSINAALVRDDRVERVVRPPG